MFNEGCIMFLRCLSCTPCRRLLCVCVCNWLGLWVGDGCVCFLIGHVVCVCVCVYIHTHNTYTLTQPTLYDGSTIQKTDYTACVVCVRVCVCVWELGGCCSCAGVFSPSLSQHIQRRGVSSTLSYITACVAYSNPPTPPWEHTRVEYEPLVPAPYIMILVEAGLESTMLIIASATLATGVPAAESR